MCECGGSDFLACEHARDLGDALVARIEPANARPRVTAGVFFPYVEVRRTEARDLGEMCHANDLIAYGELLQLSPDDLRDAAADAGVDLVEHERRGGGVSRGLEKRRRD